MTTVLTRSSSRSSYDPGTARIGPDVRRTLYALLASALGVLPLIELVSDLGWLFDVWVTMIVVVAPAAVLRRTRPPSAGQIWIGLLLMVLWLTGRFLHDHALAGVIPTAQTWTRVRALLSDLHHTTTVEVAPVHSTIAIKLTLCALLGLVAALVDLIAVVGRRGALAGVPLLVIFTISGAVPREPVSWYLFAIAAAAFLILLGLDSSDDLQRWGHYVPRPNRLRSRTAETGQRVGAIAIVLAVLLPAFVPANSGNLLADLFHDAGNSGLDTGLGRGNGSGVGGIDPFAGLRGQLNRKEPINLLDVTVTSQSGDPIGPESKPQLFYARTNVLSTFDKNGWRQGPEGSLESLDSTQYSADPGTEFPPTAVRFDVRVSVTNLTSNPPVFAQPTDVEGLDSDARWSRQDLLLEGTRIHPGDSYQMAVQQPAPSVGALEAASGADPSLDPWMERGSVTDYVQSLVQQLTAGAVTPYDRAMAIYQYFTDPANQFAYSLNTATANTGDALNDFLLKKIGYCQQYAAAMAIMLRQANVPSRVVLGYTHELPDDGGTFTITTNNAHSWVEAYFDGIGWVPFDPTPLAGIADGAANDLPWAQHPKTSGVPLPAPTGQIPTTSAPPSSGATSSSAPANAASDDGRSLRMPLLATAIVIVLAVIVLVPWGVRQRKRSQRMRRARHGDTDALWAELSDTATDYGYVWSAARTPRQVAAWLAQPAGPAADQLRELAGAVERVRYAPTAHTPAVVGDPAEDDVVHAGRPAGSDAEGAQLTADLAAVRAGLRAQRSFGERVRMTLFPASLGWRGPVAFLRSARRRH